MAGRPLSLLRDAASRGKGLLEALSEWQNRSRMAGRLREEAGDARKHAPKAREELAREDYHAPSA